MKTKRIFLLLAMSVLLLWDTGFCGEKVLVLTEDYPPRNFEKNGEIKGLCVELVREMFKRAHIPMDLRLVAWKDGYRMAQKRPAVGLFSTTRTKEREALFHWIGPLDSQQLGLFGRKDQHLTINTIDDANKVRRIGTYKDDVMEQMLLERGFKNLESVSNQVLNLKKLMAGRINMVASEKLELSLIAQKEGVNPDHLEFLYSFGKSDLYLVFSRSTPLPLVNKLRKALDGMKKDGFFQTASARWYKN